MFHRVAPIGGPDPASIEDATFEVELLADQEGPDWRVVDQGRELLRYNAREIRVSVSWKAEVFADDKAARVRSEHLDDLSLDHVVTALVDDLEKRGHDLIRPENPLRDEGFIRLLNEAYPLPVPKG
jgi:hypothetical protein